MIKILYLMVCFSGARPLPHGFVPPPTACYSRESTPDSGGSHYMDSYRESNGERKMVLNF